MSYDSHPARHRNRGGRQRRHRGGESQTSIKSRTSKPHRSKPPEKQSFLQKLLGLFGIGEKPAPEERLTAKSADAPTATRTKAAPTAARAREERPARQPRPPVVHEVTSGRLYVGNLSYDATESDLFELFGGVGKVRNAEIVYHKHNHRSKGYAFVEMSGIDEARRAVEVLNDNEFMGRKLLVSGARSPSLERDSQSRDRSSGESGAEGARTETTVESSTADAASLPTEGPRSAEIGA
jgi:hypothetical protein